MWGCRLGAIIHHTRTDRNLNGPKNLPVQEGAAIVAFKLVTGGGFDEAGVSKLLHAPGKRGNPACSGTRNLQDNLSDLRAQARFFSHICTSTGGHYPGTRMLGAQKKQMNTYMYIYVYVYMPRESTARSFY